MNNMTGLLLALQVLAGAIVGTWASSEAGNYLVTAPQTARVGSAYTVTAQVFNAQQPVTISAFIERGEYNSGSGQVQHLPVTTITSRTLMPGAIEIISLQVPSGLHNAYDYRLHIRGTGGLQIEETYSIDMIYTEAEVFLQTDKQDYIVGDTVTVKTFALRRDLTPYSGNYTVTLTAGNYDIKMAVWEASEGINTFTYTLDAFTFIKDWALTTSYQGQGAIDLTRLKFTVVPKTIGNAGWLSSSEADKILAKDDMEVKVTIPKSMNSSTPLVGTFTASYPMGVGVNGRADIELIGNGIRKHTLRFNGSASFTFPYTDLTNQNTRVKVTVVDEETGLTGSGESTVQVYERDIKIEFTEQTPTVFKPHIPYDFQVKITTHAGEPIIVPPNSIFNTVYIYGVGHYNRNYDHPNFLAGQNSGSFPILARIVTLPDTGLLSVTMDVPDDVTSMDLRVTFQGVQASLQVTRVTLSSNDAYLQLSLLGHVPPVTDTQDAKVQFRVLSSQPLTDLTAELVSRKRIVSIVHPTLTNKVTSGDHHSAEFTMTLTWDMTPATEVIVYQTIDPVNQNSRREIVADSLVLNVEGLQQNQVTVTSAHQRVNPGARVALQLHARAGSNVGVFVEEDNGATAQRLTSEELAAYVSQNMKHPISTNDVMSLSAASGSVAFSNVQLLLMNGYGERFTLTTNGLRQTETTSTTSVEPRTLFFGTSMSGQDGSASFSVKLSDDVKTWRVTGFAFDSSGHVGFVSQPLKIVAAYDVYAEVVGADHLISEEHMAVAVIVHNSLTSDAQVHVTIHPLQHVEVVTFAADRSFQTSAADSRQIITVPAKGSMRIFFTVTSPAGRYDLSNNKAGLQVHVVSGASKQTVPFTYTVVSPGVEQKFTEAAMVSVNGHATGDLSVPLPKTALAGTDTRLVQVEASLTEQLLPLALGELDVMDEGTGSAALLHLALPVMLARWRPDQVQNLLGPIERGYQRLVSTYDSSKRDAQDWGSWQDLALMQYWAEAKDHVFVDDKIPLQTLFQSFTATYLSNQHLTASFSSRNVMFLESVDALEAYAAVVVLDLANHVTINTQWTDYVSGHNVAAYNVIKESLREFVQQPTNHTDALTLSYHALAQARFAYVDLANRTVNAALALQDPTGVSSSEIFWNSSPNDTFSYFGSWLSGRKVAASKDIVTAANVLQVLVMEGRNDEATKVAKWLVRQMTANGRFNTAWDTITALEALLMFDNQPLAGTHGHQNQLHADAQWSRESSAANFSASGHGNAFTLVQMKYYVTDDAGAAAYETVPVVLDETLQHFKLMICTRWLLTDRSSGLTVLDVTVPSGFVADINSVSPRIFTFEQKSDNLLTMYLQQAVEADSTCYTMSVNRVYPVARSAPGYIITRSFSHPELHDVVIYHGRRLEQSSICDLCDGCCPLP